MVRAEVMRAVGGYSEDRRLLASLDVHAGQVRVVRREDFQADGCESVDAVFVANNCNLIHKAFSPSLE